MGTSESSDFVLLIERQRGDWSRVFSSKSMLVMPLARLLLKILRQTSATRSSAYLYDATKRRMVFNGFDGVIRSAPFAS